MTWYRTQREVCEYFGKNPDDRKFVGRKIAKGEIRKVDGGYEIVWDSVAKSVAHDTVECGNNTTVSELQGKITLLENSNKELKEENKNLKDKIKELESKGTVNTVDDLYRDAFEQLDQEHEKLKESVKDIYVNYCHKYVPNWKEFKAMYDLDIYVPGEDD